MGKESMLMLIIKLLIIIVFHSSYSIILIFIYEGNTRIVIVIVHLQVFCGVPSLFTEDNTNLKNMQNNYQKLQNSFNIPGP